MPLTSDAGTTPLPWDARLLPVDVGLTSLATASYDRVHVTATWHGQPLGRVVIETPLDHHPESLLRSEVLTLLEGALVRGDLDGSPVVGSALRATVLICTRDRPVDLARCLARMGALQPPVHEVVVVDNGTTPELTRQVVAAAGARYVLERLAGLDRARNRGFAAATGDVVLCTDDDVEVDPEWAARLLACFADPLVVAATGLVLPALLDTAARQDFETHATFVRGFSRRVFDGTLVPAVKAGGAGAGASMAFLRSFVAEEGGFPEELDAGTPTESGGDTYLLYLALRRGRRIVYEPRAIAHHHHRDDATSLERVVRGYGTGTFSYFAHAVRLERDASAAIAASRWAVRRFLLEPLRTRLRRPASVPLSLLAAEAKGAWATWSAYPTSRRMTAARPSVAIAPAGAAGREPLPALGDDAPRLAVVIPTRGRKDSLLRLLDSLDLQDYPAGRVEVRVGLDGDLDGTGAALGSRAGRWPVTVVQGQPSGAASGAGATRNRAALGASADVLLFLDDDVLPEHPGLFAQHARQHLDRSVSRAGVGACPPSPSAARDLHGHAVSSWWTDQARSLATSPTLSFAEVMTGNLSCSRAAFENAGGFRALPRREDWELGFRLGRAGVELVGVPDAAVIHDADLVAASACSDRFLEGAGDVAIAQAHPELLCQLPLGGWRSVSPREWGLAELLSTRPSRRGRVLTAALRVTTSVGSLGATSSWRRLHGTVMRVSYWAGVLEAVGGRPGWEALLSGHTHSTARLTLAEVDQVPTKLPPGLCAFSLVSDDRALAEVPVTAGGVPWKRDQFLSHLHRYHRSDLLAAQLP